MYKESVACVTAPTGTGHMADSVGEAAIRLVGLDRRMQTAALLRSRGIGLRVRLFVAAKDFLGCVTHVLGTGFGSLTYIFRSRFGSLTHGFASRLSGVADVFGASFGAVTDSLGARGGSVTDVFTGIGG